MKKKTFRESPLPTIEPPVKKPAPQPETPDTTPERKPKPNPFRPPKPEIMPQPQNKLHEAYNDEAHPGTQKFFKTPTGALAGHPILGKHGHTLAQGAFGFTADRMAAKNVSVAQMYQMMQVYQQVLQREAKHKTQLVQLAKRAVSEIWGIDINDLQADLTQQVDPNQTEQAFKQELGAKIDPRVQSHIHMRSTINMLTHGAAVHHMLTIHHMIADELNQLDPTLLDMYDKLAAGSTHIYWFMDIARMAAMLTQMAVGSARVDYTQEDEPVVVAKGVCLPVLCQELSKGVMMLLSHHHLGKLDKATATAVVKHADAIELEPWYIMIGPELWRKFNIVAAKLKGVSRAEVIAKLANMEPQEAHDVLLNIIENPARAEQLLQ